MSKSRRITVKPAEKALLGFALDQEVSMPDRPEEAYALTSQLKLLRAYLAARPSVAEEFSKKAEAEWDNANGDRAAYLMAMREPSAQVLCRAQLVFASEQGRTLTADLVDGLSEYLKVVEKLTYTRVTLA